MNSVLPSQPLLTPRIATRNWIIASGALGLGLCLLAGLAQGREQTPAANPFTGDREAIRVGAGIFRTNCSVCHGLNAGGGVRGPSLTANRWAHGGADQEIFRTVTHGVAGTEMPANDLEDAEVWKVIAYLRSLAPVSKKGVGNATAGRALFESKGCSGCHMVNGSGGVLGPELSRVGAARSAAYLIDSIRTPDKQFSIAPPDPNDHYGLPPPLDTVIVVTRSGERITGIARNEDSFSIQLMDVSQQLHLFDKADLAAVTHEHRSLMPAYAADALDERQLQDLVAYLGSLK
jgi:cytochrome c oxidase cbb3-type subunit 3